MAKELLRLGAQVVMACPIKEKAVDAGNKILKELVEAAEVTDREGLAARLVVIELKISSISSIQDFVEVFPTISDRVDILIHNTELKCMNLKYHINIYSTFQYMRLL